MTIGFQKVCDIHDFFDPDIDDIIRHKLHTPPFSSRRAWEFAMNYRALRASGVLRPNARGLAMGAGTERLIYAIVPEVAHTVVTDLYVPDSGWVGVRTENPRDLIAAKAPWKIDPAKYDARAMDMRKLDFPDESFDFCWSTGSFEHIGDDEDFLAHFREVERVLKPGGVYAFTTAVTFGGATERIPHNYYFDPDHLIDLIHASPLHPEPIFDCGIRDHIYNRPHPERLQDFGYAAFRQFTVPVVSLRRGVILTANAMLLTKDRGREKRRAKVVGLAETSARLRRQADALVKATFERPQLMVGAAKGRVVHFQPQSFGSGTLRIDATLPLAGPHLVGWSVESRAASGSYDWTREARGVLAPLRSGFTLPVVAERLYRLSLRALVPGAPERVQIRAKVVPAAG